MSPIEPALIDKIRLLHPRRRAEVEDFVDFLRARENEMHLTRLAATGQRAQLCSVWESEDDAACDRM